MTLDQLYQQRILEHNQHPQHFGPLPSATHRGRGIDALCGDDIEVALVIEDGRVLEAKFCGEACAVTKASASMLMPWLVGRPVTEIPMAYGAFQQLLANPEAPAIELLGELNDLQPVGAFPARRGNACLPWQATLEALGPKLSQSV